MGKLYLGICKDVYRDGKWLQTVVVPEGYYTSYSGSVWRGLKYRLKKDSKAYKGGLLCFQTFNDFVVWHQNQLGYNRGWHLDKDLFGDYSIYSKYTCCLLPPDLNVLLQGVGSWKRGELVGSSFFKRDSNWRAYGNDHYKQVHLGYYDTQQEAHRAWCLDKANRIEAYDKSELQGRIKSQLEILVDRLRTFN